jgi:hypothetical protein
VENAEFVVAFVHVAVHKEKNRNPKMVRGAVVRL